MKTQTLFALFFFACLSPLFAQEVMTIRHSCNFYGEETEEDKYIFPANAEAKQIIDEILKHSGLSAKFEIKESNCSNALAAIEGKQRFILYNPIFLQQFKQDANTKWAAYCVLAHEIAHHLNNHDLEETDPKKRRAFELEADKYAGFLLFHLGASLEEAQMGIETIKQEGATNTHPPKTARLVAIANGWTQASDLSGGEQPAPDTTTPTRPGNMVLIKGGTFQMGSNSTQNDEKPVHAVTLSDFYIGKHEVTNAEYCLFLNEKGNQSEGGAEWINLSGNYDQEKCRILQIGKQFSVEAGYDDYPVIYVSWYGAKAYCDWLTEKAGKNNSGYAYRLPTEAEWEYAAGNGNKHTKFSWGAGDPNGRSGGNIADLSAAKVLDASSVFRHYNDGVVFSAPVGSYDSNEFGIFDMTGNVREWCSDWYAGDYYAKSPLENPPGSSQAMKKVTRGGSWLTLLKDCGVASRSGAEPETSTCDIGFRVVQPINH